MPASPVVTADIRPALATDAEVQAALLRLTAPAYADGTDAPRAAGADPEQVAFELFTQGDLDTQNDLDLSALWIFWGQFVDHDLDRVPEQAGEGVEFLKIDPPFDLVRSEFVTDGDGLRQQVNALTPEMDASNVYGSSAAATALLRTGTGGLMKSQPGIGPDLLPTADQVSGNGGTGLVAGDIRAAENTALTSVHSLWINEHNRWAGRIAAADPGLDDEAIFQQARAVVETLIQKITYEEFLPALVGDAIAPWTAHDPSLDTQVTNEFATAAFRFGHTAIPAQLTYLAEDGTETRSPDPLFALFDNSSVLLADGMVPTLRGLLEQPAQKLDTLVVDALNFLLFTPDGGLTGFSLPERNILRGHDHGIDSWLNVRAAVLGDVDAGALAGSTDFSVISADPAVQSVLAALYGTVDAVDLWVGGLAEAHVPGTTMGPTFGAIIAEQFTRTRDGDAFWWENRDWADPDLLSEIEATSLSEVLMRSGGIEHVQREAMLASDRMAGDAGHDKLDGGSGRDLMIGFGGDDDLRGMQGDDDLFGDAGKDMLWGGTGNDGLTGGADADKLMGHAGDDILSGGDGSDVLHGGAGNDQFVFVSGETGMDQVKDFRSGQDLIVLKGFGASFADLAIIDADFQSIVSIGGIEIAGIQGGDRFDLDADDFQFIG